MSNRFRSNEKIFLHSFCASDVWNMSILYKKYSYYKSEGLDKFLKALGDLFDIEMGIMIINFKFVSGVNYILRKLAQNVSVTVQLIKNDDNSFTFSATSPFKNKDIKFIPGVEFDEETIDGQKARCVFMFEGNKMIQQQIGGHEIRIEREFFDDEMIVKFMFHNYEATRWFKAVN